MKEGWEEKRLGEIISFQRGLTYSKKDEVEKSENIVLRSNNIDLKTNKLDLTELKYINEKIKIPVEKKVEKDTLLICTANGSKSHLGKVALIDKDYDYAFGGFMGKIKTKEEVDAEYLFYNLISESYKKFINNISDAININNLRFDVLKEFKIFLPPIEEQEKIVEILDKAFEAIDRVKENAEKNLANTKELFESYLESVFANLGEGWEEKRLNDVCKVERGSSPRPIEKYITSSAEGVNWIKIGDTKNVVKYIYSTGQKITKEGALKSRLVVEGDFILTNSMSLGKPYIMRTKGYIHDGWYVLRLNKNIDAEFFYYLLSSPLVQKQFTALSNGAIVKNISSDLVKKAVLFIPPIEEQEKIAERIDRISEEIKRSELIYRQKIKDMEELKKSVLEKAFKGELNTEINLENL